MPPHGAENPVGTGNMVSQRRMFQTIAQYQRWNIACDPDIKNEAQPRIINALTMGLDTS